MICHAVMLRLAPGADSQELARVMAGLDAVVARRGGCYGFAHGPNRDFEAKTPGFTYGFVFYAADAATLAGYAEDPEHQAWGARLVALCEGGADGIRVYDLDVPG